MDARLFFRFFVSMFLVFMLSTATSAARFETANFSVDNAPTQKLAKEFCETAERCRNDLAILWLGESMPDWSVPCPIKVRVGEHLGAGGSTTFIFQGGEVYGWEMDIQGSAERILDSVLPHEITHMILASHLREPVPRWLDEGAATSVEHDSEKEKYRKMIRHFLREDVRKCLPFNRMVALKEYPDDVMPFYAQGFSVIEYLIAVGGHQRLVRFAETGTKTKDWNTALQKHYGFASLGDLQKNYWVKWVSAGSPRTLTPELSPGAVLAASAVSVESEKSERFQPLEPITLVSAKPSPQYGQSRVIPIPTTTRDGSRVIAIPSVYEVSAESVSSASRHDLRKEEGTGKNGDILVDCSSSPPLFR